MGTLRAGPAEARVDRARGGRLASLVVHGHELLVQPDPRTRPDPLLWGCYPMVPFAGRVRGGRFMWGGALRELAPNHAGHAMHGTLFDQHWAAEVEDATYVRLRADLHPRWPFEGWALHEVSLREDRLELRLEVHTARAPFPATCGWHPWFNRRLAVGGRLDVDLRAGRYYPRGPDGLPTGVVEPPPPRGPWDDCFTAVTWPVSLTWPGALDATLTATTTHLVLYDQQAHAVCVEPQTGPPDALNHLEWAHIVRPDKPLVAEMALTWSLP